MLAIGVKLVGDHAEPAAGHPGGCAGDAERRDQQPGDGDTHRNLHEGGVRGALECSQPAEIRMFITGPAAPTAASACFPSIRPTTSESTVL